ncbi:MAG: 1-acyl-sn-glycerol-3-phosphate acyltransferase [Alphaproteobacteria bacterium]|nr:1-acyl-sn-glycerol-3-phosphate acyltransferase [Alphaproteobacteria bacterium]
MGSTRAISRIVLLALWTLPLMPLQWLFVRLGLAAARWLPVVYHRGLCRLIGFRVLRFGQPTDERPVLLVANHTSWLDIPVLSALSPLSFVAKHEVDSWPFFGTLARLQRTVFVERRAVRAAEGRDDLQRRLDAGDRLVLFPEGTSSDGNRVLPFKTAFFAVASNGVGGRALTVQPVSVAYVRLDGLPVGRRFRPLFAWYGGMALLPHLWQVLKLGRSEVEVEFHPPVTIAGFRDRKALAAHCHETIAHGLGRALSGRRPQA